MYILIIILCIIAIPFILALFKKNEFHMQREVVINKPKNEVFNFIKYLKNHDKFSVWMSLDPAMKREFKGTDGTAGFVSAWDSQNKKVGQGEQTILGIKEGEKIDFEVHFIRPWENRAHAYMTTQALSDNQTKVTWAFDSPINNYGAKLMHTVMNMDKMIGKDFDAGLHNLKTVLEKQ